MRIAAVLLALALIAPLPAAAQEGTATPLATTSLAALAPDEIVAALEEAEAPSTLPGNTDAEIALATWEEHYGERLDGVLGAWVMTGSAVFPMATVLVFATDENAERGLGTYREESSETVAGDLTAWTIADRGKWLCVAVDGPVLLIGQAEPANTDEDPEVVRERSCAVTAATHAWLLETVGVGLEATPES